MNLNAISMVLGGESVINLKLETEMDLFELSRRGVPKLAATTLAKSLDLTFSGFVNLYLSTSLRTLQRKKNEEILEPEVSEQIIQVAEVYTRGLEVFDGDEYDFKLWNSLPNRALGNRKPEELLKNHYGVKMVLETLGRMDSGVYS